MAVLEELLQKSAVVVGLRYQGLTVKQIQDFRRSLPADTKLLVCKNTLMRVAADKVGGWEELMPATKGDNAWMFVNEEVGAGRRPLPPPPPPAGAASSVCVARAACAGVQLQPPRPPWGVTSSGLCCQTCMHVHAECSMHVRDDCLAASAHQPHPAPSRLPTFQPSPPTVL